MIKKALFLEYFTVGYNILEGIVSILVGLGANSIALVGFGLDSFIESSCGGIMVWRLKKSGKVDKCEEEKVEKKAIKLIAFSFFILAAYILYESVKKLYFLEIPEPSFWGIVITVVSILIMIPVFLLKNKIGRMKNLKSLVIDAKQSLVCMLLSVTVLLGLGLNYFYGIWWADPAAALAIVGFLIKEGYSALRKSKLCDY